MNLENYFEKYRENTIGLNHEFVSPYGIKKIIYADWTASGRIYSPIENRLNDEIYPFVGNTHTETSVTGATMNLAFHYALRVIKDSVNANNDDVIISAGAGMTMLINKFQRILGLKIHERFKNDINISERPVVFVSHMEHHSNQTTWLETICDVQIINATQEGLVDLNSLSQLLDKYKDRKLKIAAITSCSNVTGVMTPYYKIAEMMHKENGLCFVDFACSAPYIEIDMHPKNKLQSLDAIYFSPHKFLGGPGSTGILIFNKDLYKNRVPDNPGGGTVKWTNPWGNHGYVDDIELREDGGTPAFLQTIRSALCFKLKEQIGIDKIMAREKELHSLVWPSLNNIPNLHVLAKNISERLCIYSFYIDDLHYNLGVQLLNDKFGIQTRGGCSCAGTYGHYLLNVDYNTSCSITNNIEEGILDSKPGWIRMSLHPIMTNKEVNFIISSIQELCKNHKEWSKDYRYNRKSNDFSFVKSNGKNNLLRAQEWFDTII